MEIREVLQLEANASSIKKIERFLATKNPANHEYAMALAQLGYLTFKLGNTKEAFQLIMGFLEYASDKQKPDLYNALIKIYYDQKDYKNVYQAIITKKKYLQNYNHRIFYEDLIEYYKIIDDDKNLISTLLMYLDDDLSEEKRLEALKEITELYLKVNDYPHFKEKNQLLLTLTLSLKDLEAKFEALYNEAYVLMLEGTYLEALKITEELLENNLKPDLKIYTYGLKIHILVGLKEYRNASIFEAEHESELKLGSLLAQKFYCEGCLKLYERLNNRFNKEAYEDKLKEIEKDLEQAKTPKETSPKKIKKVSVDLSFFDNLNLPETKTPEFVIKEKEEPVLKETEKVVYKREPFTFLEGASQFDNLAVLFNDLNNLGSLNLREYLRLFFINLEKLSTFKEAFVFIREENLYYHYKVERLYKKDQEKLYFLDSIPFNTYKRNEEILVDDTKKSNYKSILTGENMSSLDSLSVISFPLSFGSLTFTDPSEKLIYEKLNYESLRLAKSFLELKLMSFLTLNLKEKENSDYLFIINNIISGYKKQQDNYLYLSKTCQEMFKTYASLSASEFYSLIDSEDLIGYKKLINLLVEGKLKEGNYTYRAKINGETHYFNEIIKVTEEGLLLSVINDVSKDVLKNLEVVNKSYLDPLTKTNSKQKLILDLNSKKPSDKFSLFLFNVKNFKLYNELYGYEFGDDLIYAIPKCLKKVLKENTEIYHYDSDKFILLIRDLVDKRTCLKQALELANELTKALENLNYRLKIYFEVGIIRYPTDNISLDSKEILRRLFASLNTKASLKNENQVSFYDENLFKKRFFETSLVTNISEAIDQNLILVNYEQVVNALNESCYFYEAKINLTNYPVKEALIKRILIKRDKLSQMERYLIHKTIFELSELYKEVKIYFKVSILVSYETLTSDSFVDYLLEQLKFFAVPKDSLIITYNEEVNEESLKALNHLKTAGILLKTSNLELIKVLKVNYFTYLLAANVYKLENNFIKNLNDFCQEEGIDFILGNVNNPAILKNYASLGIKYYSGKIYSARLVLKDILSAYKLN